MVSLTFPSRGVDASFAHGQQPPGTTPDCENVAFFDPFTQRDAGASRYGSSLYLTDKVVGSYSIQDINQLTGNDVFIAPASSGQAVRGNTATNGAAVISSAHAAVFTYDDDYTFACSCWDDSNNVYIATYLAGAVRIRRYSSAGVLAWTYEGLTAAADTPRRVAGMVVIANYLIIALTNTFGVLYTLNILGASNGVVVAAPWKTNGQIDGMQFSDASHNCLAKIGTTLAVECVGTGTNQSLKAFSLQTGAFLWTAAYGGAVSHEAAKVVSDGANYFYAITSVTTNKLKKISLAGTIEWSSNVVATPTSLCFDFLNGMLVVCRATSPCVFKVSPTDGTTISSTDLNAGGITAVHEVDSDNLGVFTFWRNGVASNDILATNTTFGTVTGPTTFANTTHTGASVNKGKQPAAVAGSREIRLLVTSNGEVRRVSTTGTTAITGGAAFNASAPVIFSAQNGLDMYFADGTAYKRYRSTSNQIIAWTPTAGSLPVDAHTGRARLIERWRGRIVLFGLPRDPQNWFMSRVNDSLDWDYEPDEESEDQAVSGNNSPAGLLGDVITCGISYSDDTFIWGCDHSIWQMTGDPAAGGRIDLVSDKIGMAWGRPYCKDPYGRIYFMSNECGVYRMVPGNLPELISEPIADRLADFDYANSIVRMVWDTYMGGFFLILSPKRPGQLAEDAATTNSVVVGYGSAAGFEFNKGYPDKKNVHTLGFDGKVRRVGVGIAQHFFCQVRETSQGPIFAWFPVTFRNPDHNPVAVYEFDADAAADRVILLGGRDGYLRFFDREAINDDGYDISTMCVFGPIMTKELDDLLFEWLKPTLGETSNDVNWSFHVGNSAEKALRTKPAISGSWSAGNGPVSSVRASGVVGFLKITSTSSWVMEVIRCRLRAMGETRQRIA